MDVLERAISTNDTSNKAYHFTLVRKAFLKDPIEKNVGKGSRVVPKITTGQMNIHIELEKAAAESSPVRCKISGLPGGGGFGCALRLRDVVSAEVRTLEAIDNTFPYTSMLTTQVNWSPDKI